MSRTVVLLRGGQVGDEIARVEHGLHHGTLASGQEEEGVQRAGDHIEDARGAGTGDRAGVLLESAAEQTVRRAHESGGEE